MLEAVQTEMARGNIIRLGELGSLRVSFSSEGKENQNEVNANAIKSSKVVFSPGPDIKEMLKNLRFEKA